MGRKRICEGGKHSPRLPYVAIVEGVEAGVPFRTFYKRLCCAERDARAVRGAILTDLRDLTRRTWINNQWKVC